MGGGSWDDTKYLIDTTTRKEKGLKAFAYTEEVRTKSPQKWKCHPLLDPKGINGKRESRDSDEHPESLAIMVMFDVTGSMGGIPTVFQEKLNSLMNDVKTKAGVAHPHIMVGAIGDSFSDKVPMQVGQFESDNRVDEQLRLIFIERGGGPSITESYQLAHYVAATKTSTDCWEKRQKKGYLFTMGDEMPYQTVTRGEALSVFNDVLDKDLSTAELVARAQEQYHVFHVIVSQGSAGMDPEVEAEWRKLLGQNVLRLDDANAVTELIVNTIAQKEKNLTKSVKRDPIPSTDTNPKDTKKKPGRI